jgi:hypothetical protein
MLRISIRSDGFALVWLDDDESDSVAITGEPGAVEAMARALRSLPPSAVEHEFSQRGSRAREPFVSDLTAADHAEAKRAADLAATAAMLAQR